MTKHLKQGELMPYVVKDTGITLMIKKVSPFLAAEIRRAFPEPRPPAQEVDYGDGRKVMEENPAHPDHLQALRKYNEEFELKMRKLIIQRGVAVEVTDEIKREVSELREYMKTEQGIDLPADDKMVYVCNIAIGTEEDVADLINAITKRSHPTEAEVALQAQSFRG